MKKNFFFIFCFFLFFFELVSGATVLSNETPSFSFSFTENTFKAQTNNTTLVISPVFEVGGTLIEFKNLQTEKIQQLGFSYSIEERGESKKFGFQFFKAIVGEKIGFKLYCNSDVVFDSNGFGARCGDLYLVFSDLIENEFNLISFSNSEIFFRLPSTTLEKITIDPLVLTTTIHYPNTIHYMRQNRMTFFNNTYFFILEKRDEAHSCNTAIIAYTEDPDSSWNSFDVLSNRGIYWDTRIHPEILQSESKMHVFFQPVSSYTIYYDECSKQSGCNELSDFLSSPIIVVSNKLNDEYGVVATAITNEQIMVIYQTTDYAVKSVSCSLSSNCANPSNWGNIKTIYSPGDRINRLACVGDVNNSVLCAWGVWPETKLYFSQYYSSIDAWETPTILKQLSSGAFRYNDVVVDSFLSAYVFYTTANAGLPSVKFFKKQEGSWNEYTLDSSASTESGVCVTFLPQDLNFYVFQDKTGTTPKIFLHKYNTNTGEISDPVVLQEDSTLSIRDTTCMKLFPANQVFNKNETIYAFLKNVSSNYYSYVETVQVPLHLFFIYDEEILDPENGKTTAEFNFVCPIEALSYEWREDGELVGTNYNLTRYYSSPTTKEMCLTAYFSETESETYCENIKIKQYPQNVEFTWEPLIGSVNLPIQFFGSAEDEGTIEGWSWLIEETEFATTQNAEYAFSRIGDYEVCLKVKDDDDLEKEKCHSVPVQYGSLRFQFFDEKTKEKIKPTLLIDENNYSDKINDEGYISLNLKDFVEKDYEIIAYTTTHQTRYFNFYLTQSSVIDFNVGLLETQFGNTIDFLIKDENNTTYPDTYVGFYLSETELVGRKKTDSDGKVSFFLNGENEDYYYVVEKETENIRFNQITLTIKKPKNEKTNTLIVPTNFTVRVSGLKSKEFLNQNNDVSFKILTNTLQTYNVNVDVNEEFFSRNYFVFVFGRNENSEIQPYLLSTEDGSRTWFFVSKKTGNPIPQIFIQTKRYIDGNWLLIESSVTDDTGTTVFVFEPFKEYRIEFYDVEKDLIVFKTVQISTTSYYVYLELVESEVRIISQTTASGIAVDFFPRNRIIFASSPYTLSQKIRLKNSNISIEKINIKIVSSDGNTVYDETFGSLGNGEFTQTIVPANEESLDLNITITITTKEGEEIEFEWIIRLVFKTTQPVNIWLAISNLGEELNDTTKGIIALIVSLILTGAIGGIALNVVGFGFSELSLIFCLFLTFFTFLGWLNPFIYGFAVFISFVAVVLEKREII